MPRLAPLLLALPLALACSDGATSGAGGETRSANGTVARSGPTLAVKGSDKEPAYRVVPLAAAGRVTGTVRVAPGIAAAPDTAALPAAAGAVCVRAAAAERTAAAGRGNGETIVWLLDARSGKPLPELRRAEVAIDDCRFRNAVVTAVAGSAIQVGSFDGSPHQLKVMHAGAEAPTEIFTFRYGGQLVANESLAKTPAIYEVRCAVHGTHRATLAVFDHPYFAVTAADGSFAIDSVPPGSYRVAAWRDGKKGEGTVQVAANGAAQLTLDLK